ncbi:uncharacterized protein LOC144555372 isoform X1 [Carex rostrata]
MSSDNSSYESAPLAPDPEAETLTNGPTTGGETMVPEEGSKPTTDPIPNPNPNTDLPKRRGRKKKEVPIEAPPNYLFKFQEEEKLVEPEGPEQAETDLFKYKVHDLVWGKVKSHPWWPGQIYDPSLASEVALKIKKEDHFLVAYFGDKTFAWNDATALKPYMTSFPKMEKQSSVETFVRGVDSSLAEISRRIEVALSCKCSDRKFLNEQLVDNAGIIDGTHVPDVDNLVILRSFKVERLMEYVQEVTVIGSENMNRLEFVMARAYLKAFDKFRGFPDAPEFTYGEEFGNDPDKLPETEKSGTSKKRKDKEQRNDDSKQGSEATPKKRGRPKKPEKKKQVFNADDSDYNLQSDSGEMPKRSSSSRKTMRVKMSSDEYDLSSESENLPKKRGRGRPKKMKQGEISNNEYDLLFGSDKMPKKRGRPKKQQPQIGISDDEFDSLSESDEAPKKRGRSKKKRQSRISDDDFDPSSESVEVPNKRGRGRPKKEKLVETSEEEAEPVSKAHSSSSKMKIPTKSDTSTPGKRGRGRPKKTKGVGISDKEFDPQSETRSPLSKPKSATKSDTGTAKRRGRPSKEAVQGPSVPVEYPPSTELLTQLCLKAENPVKSSSWTLPMQSFFTKYKDSCVPKSLEEKDLIEETGSATKSGRRVSKPKHIQDSYWTDVILDTGSDKDEVPASTSGKKKKIGPFNEKENSDSKNSEVNAVPTQENTNVFAENSDESEPTGFVLYFNNPDAIPTNEKLNEIFGSYGPLRGAETEIDKKLNRATVIFKKRADAEEAFSSTGKYSKFGPALLSYELDYSPGPPKVVPSDTNVVVKDDALTSGDENLVNNGEASTKDGSSLDVCPAGKEELAQDAIAVDKPVEPSA